MSRPTPKELRRNPTPAEVKMWKLLHPFRTGGFHFRKQVAIGPYVVDFACHHARVVIEVDGDSHAFDAENDQRRDGFMRRRGYAVHRFTNLDVMTNPDGVALALEALMAALRPTSRTSNTDPAE